MNVGRWSVWLIAAAGWPLGSAASGQTSYPEACRTDLKSFVGDFRENYAYLDRADRPWLSWETRFEARAGQAATKEACAAVLASALSELHDFHAEVRSRVPNRWLPVPTFADLWAEPAGDAALVTAVRKGSDAERAGVQVGDRIVGIGERTVLEAMADRLGGPVAESDAKARSWALLSLLAGRSEEARRITLETQDGQRRTVDLPVERRFDRGAEPVTASVLPGGLGVIRFNNSLGEQRTVAAFDQALERLKETPGLILDLRDVPSGGDSSVALGIMGRFVTNMLPYQRHRIPHYGQSDVERNWIELVAPRGPFAYRAPVVVLVDHWTGSMGEGMAIGLDAMQRATVVGTPMAHLAGAVTDFKLPATGIDVAFATEQLFHVNGTPRQDWMPPVPVTPGAHQEGDPCLRRGLEVLRSKVRVP